MAAPDRLCLQHLPGETRAFLYRGDRLAACAVERAEAAAVLGDLFLGRVTKLDPRLSGAFVDLGRGPAGLLPLNRAPAGLSEGDSLPVAVTRVAMEGKGPRLTATLPADATALLGAAAPGSAPRLLRAGLGTLAVLLAGSPTETVTDHPDLQRRLAAAGHAVRFLPGGFSAVEAGAFDAALEALLRPAAALPGGGGLLIETARTLTAVDVNLGARQGGDAVLEGNRAAAAELVRQIGLRSIGGRLVVDFPGVADARVRRSTEAALKAAFADDPERVRFLGWSRGGLYEFTRRRARPALADLLLEPDADGLGRRKSATTVAFEALRAVAQAGRSAASAPLLLRLAPALHPLVAAMPALADLQERLGLPVRLEAASDLAWPTATPFTCAVEPR